MIINDADARHFEKLSQAKVALSTAAASKARISNLETQLHVLQSQLLAQTKAWERNVQNIEEAFRETENILQLQGAVKKKEATIKLGDDEESKESAKIWEDDLFRRICIVNDKLKKNVREEHYTVGDVGAGEDVSQRWQTFLDSMIELDLLDHLQHLSQMGVCSRYGLSRMSRSDMIKAGLSESEIQRLTQWQIHQSKGGFGVNVTSDRFENEDKYTQWLETELLKRLAKQADVRQSVSNWEQLYHKQKATTFYHNLESDIYQLAAPQEMKGKAGATVRMREGDAQEENKGDDGDVQNPLHEGVHADENGLEKLKDFMANNSIFQEILTEENIEAMYEYMDVIPYKAGATITQMGENASWTGFILEGDLDVLVGDSKKKKVATMQDGDMVGELAFLEGGLRTADCVASTDGVIAALSFETLQKLHYHDPELAVLLTHAIGKAGVSKLRQRIKSVEGKKSQGKRSRKRVSGVGKLRRQKREFIGSTNKEIFYRAQVEIAKREVENQKKIAVSHIVNVEKAKKRARNADILRKKAEKEKANLVEELALSSAL